MVTAYTNTLGIVKPLSAKKLRRKCEGLQGPIATRWGAPPPLGGAT